MNITTYNESSFYVTMPYNPKEINTQVLKVTYGNESNEVSGIEFNSGRTFIPIDYITHQETWIHFYCESNLISAIFGLSTVVSGQAFAIELGIQSILWHLNIF